ncbi:MAG: hypothetical protein C4K49_06430 [Candidatus Thorarchaeota archaeon]|nr:MAG: hypothetical protein C4K49_06430 [Candidatus Thorarchaeota archaeon]
MNRKVGFTIWLVLILTMVLPLGLVMLYLDNLGISEYVTPILMPSLISMVLVFSIVAVVLAVTTRAAPQHEAVSEGVAPIAFDQPAQTESFREIKLRSRAFLMVPMYCPHCGSPVEMQRAEWVSSKRFVCPACFHDIDVRSTAG